MIGTQTVLGIIPARGGSKGIPRKNIRLVKGKPLIAWTIDAAKKSRFLDRLVLSSEDSEIMQIAAECGCDVPFRRPAELAADDTPGMAPVMHALAHLPHYDFVIVLQPTSPLRSTEDIDGCLSLCMESGSPACVSVAPCTEHPYLMYEREQDLRLRPVIPERGRAKRRQDYPDVFRLNGAVYVARSEWLKANGEFVTPETIGYEMPGERSLDIDTEEDLRLLERQGDSR